MSAHTTTNLPQGRATAAPVPDESLCARLRAAEVAVLMGGVSGEREISLRSGASIARALRDGADGRGPARVHEVEIDADGAWRVEGKPLAPEVALARFPKACVWFLALHGGAGEDGTTQGFLSTAGRTHTGSGVGASALCMSKSWTRDVLRAAGLSVAPGLVIDAHAWSTTRDSLLQRIAAFGAGGLAVKPDGGGSSVATTILRAGGDVQVAIDRAFGAGARVLVEARIEGVEATCGVLGGRQDLPRALTPVEIVPHDGRFFDYDEKYSAAGAAEHCPPLSIGEATCERIRDAAVRAFRATHCAGYARVDFMVPHPGSGPLDTPAVPAPVVLEINTLPGMTDRSLLPLAAAQSGLGYRDLCLEILRLALERPTP